MSRIVAYTYKADVYCPDCIGEVVTVEGGAYDGWALASGVSMDTEANLDGIAYAFGINQMDEHSFDSDDFPKVIFSTSINDESWEHCGACHGHIEHDARDCHDSECVGCEHDCPRSRHHIADVWCQICDDHNEASDDAEE